MQKWKNNRIAAHRNCRKKLHTFTVPSSKVSIQWSFRFILMKYQKLCKITLPLIKNLSRFSRKSKHIFSSVDSDSARLGVYDESFGRFSHTQFYFSERHPSSNSERSLRVIPLETVDWISRVIACFSYLKVEGKIQNKFTILRSWTRKK